MKTEVAQVVEMMQEYLSKIIPEDVRSNSASGEARDVPQNSPESSGGPTSPGGGSANYYSQLLDSFSHRLTMHTTHDDINSDLQNLLESLGNLSLKKNK